MRGSLVDNQRTRTKIKYVEGEMEDPKCKDRLWLKSVVLAEVTAWMVQARYVAKPEDLDVGKKFTDYGVLLPNFLQLCEHLAGPPNAGLPNNKGTVNQKLKAEGCVQRLVLNDVWRLAHQQDTIAAFVNAAVEQILNPAVAGV
jgi:hypothetical protein